MAAAIVAARENPAARITILERMDRVGKKILATGNGRCNLTNMQAGMQHFYSSDRGALKAVPQGMEPQVVLQGMEPKLVLDFFRGMGLLCQEEDEGRVYPYCKQASMVLDVLASLYWEGPSELPHRRSSSSAPRRDSTEPRPRGCSVLGEPPQALPSF